MKLTHYIVGWAQAQGYSMRALALYERRKPDEIFVNEKLNQRVVFVRTTSAGVEYLRHGQIVVG